MAAFSGRDCVKRAARAHNAMNQALEPLNKKLRDLLDDMDASVFYQSGDGWCILWGGDHNTPIAFIDIDELLKMDRADALEHLAANQV